MLCKLAHWLDRGHLNIAITAPRFVRDILVCPYLLLVSHGLRRSMPPLDKNETQAIAMMNGLTHTSGYVTRLSRLPPNDAGSD